MNKLLWSAFAMSLILSGGQLSAQTESVDDFLGLETEVLPDLQGEQRFTGEDFHQDDSWNVEPEKVIIDIPEPIKGQSYSIIPWSTIEPMEWLSLDKWVIERKVKDSIPDWKIRLREAEHKELIGKILKCSGECFIYRGTNRARVQHLSRVKEGDEITTGENSIAWVFTMDGSLMRISPESSVSMQEINIQSKEVFILARLNQGHIFWNSRSKKELPVVEEAETDTLSIPLLVRNANQEYFERDIYQQQKGEDRLAEIMDLYDNAIKEQFSSINTLKTSNSSSFLPTKLMLVSPNATVISENANFDFVYLPLGKSYFKKREQDAKLELHLRGYLVTDASKIEDSKWYEVQPNGRSYSPVVDVPAQLQILELITRRIKTLELARELWIEKFTLPMLTSVNNAENLAREYGYILWGDEQEKRLQFLLEYTRRMETTNLRSLQNLLTKMEGKGESMKRNLSEDLYRASLNNYLLGLKSRYDSKNMRIREMNDLHFYIWILKNGKF